MKRPSIQFYPADWRSNSNLKRCSLAARGAWWEIMCVLHDSDEYGVCRWPLVELLRVSGVPHKLARELLDRNVMKGSENNFAGFSHTTRHAGQDGETFVLIPACDTPVWFSSRMVVDEFVRTRRGASTRFDAENQPPSRSPTRRVGDTPTGRQGNGPTTPSPSPSPFIPSIELCSKWFLEWKKSGADYSEPEMRSAYLALSASGWMWGKNPVTDFRAALERQIQTDRQRNSKPNYANHAQKPNPRNLGIAKDAAEQGRETVEFLKRRAAESEQST